MIVIAWIGAVVIGLSLGLLGSGGSILTVPVLVYLLGQSDKAAIAASLAIVGGIAVPGALVAGIQRRVHWRSVLLFGGAGIPGAWAGSWLARFVPGSVQLTTFAVVLLVAAWFTARGRASTAAPPTCHRCGLLIALQGIAVGVLTGFVGVGGGFLIVPALMLLGGLPIEIAVGSSLVIIVVNSWTGLLMHLKTPTGTIALDWELIATFIAVGAVGSVAGQLAARRVPRHQLKVAFAVFLVAVGGFVLWRALPQVL